jgi:hypothetical protein
VWAAIEELAAGYLKEQVAATMDQARADAFVDLILANAVVSTVVDLAQPAGFATAGAARGGSVVRVLAGLAAVGVLDQRAGTLTSASIEAILADPDTVFRRLVIDPDRWLVDAGATTYHPAGIWPRWCVRGMCDPLPAGPHPPGEPGLPMPESPPPQDPRPLVPDHEPAWGLYLGRPPYRRGPHHRTGRLPRARSLTDDDACRHGQPRLAAVNVSHWLRSPPW